MTKNEIKVRRDENGKVVAGIVSRTFYNKANKFRTPEFDKWEQFIMRYPEAKMEVIKKAKVAVKPKEEKKVRPSYAAMIKFINTQENSEEYLKAMNRYKDMAKINRNSYNVVVEWFNNTFEDTPDYKSVFKGIITEDTHKIEIVNTNPEVVEA